MLLLNICTVSPCCVLTSLFISYLPQESLLKLKCYEGRTDDSPIRETKETHFPHKKTMGYVDLQEEDTVDPFVYINFITASSPALGTHSEKSREKSGRKTEKFPRNFEKNRRYFSEKKGEKLEPVMQYKGEQQEGATACSRTRRKRKPKRKSRKRPTESKD